MIKTPNLDLPIYDKPSTDTFKVADWNKANENIDYVFGELKKNPNVNAIDIKAREDIINNHRSVTEHLDSKANKTDLDSKADKSMVDTVSSKIQNNELNFKPLQYGRVILPSDFNKIYDFDIYRDFDGITKCNFDVSRFINSTKIIYLSENGKDTNDGLTTSTALRTLNKAIEIANSQTESQVIISILNKCFSRGGAGSGLTFTLNKNIVIQADESIGRCFLGTFERNDSSGLAWTIDGSGIYSATVSDNPQYVLDSRYLDYRGIPRQYVKVSSLQDLNKGCYLFSSGKVYLKPFSLSDTDTSKILIVGASEKNQFILGAKQLIFKNIDFLYNTNVSDTTKRGSGVEVIEGLEGSKFISYNCTYSHSCVNGLFTKKVNYAYIINSTCANNGADGFNYDGRKVANPYEIVVEFNCHSYNNGQYRYTDGSNNATTAHGGIHILRVGSIGLLSDGPILADVNGCYSICIDCNMRDSLSTYPNYKTNACFYFDSVGGATSGKAIVINCGGYTGTGYGLSSDNIVSVSASNFRGKINQDITVAFL